LGFTAAVFRQGLTGKDNGEIVRGDAAGCTPFGEHKRFGRDGLGNNVRGFERPIIAGTIIAGTIVTRAIVTGTVVAGVAATTRAASATALPAASTIGIAFRGPGLAVLAARGSFGGLQFRLDGGFCGARGALIALLVAGFAGLGFAAATAGIDAFEVGRVFFLLFEKIGDVEESVAFESDIDKRGLHAGEDPGDTALVDRAG
jgi:hypothetical protein